MSEIMEVDVNQTLEEVIAGNLVELANGEVYGEDQRHLTDNTVKLLGARNTIIKEADDYAKDLDRKELDKINQDREFEIRKRKAENEIDIQNQEFELRKLKAELEMEQMRRQFELDKEYRDAQNHLRDIEIRNNDRNQKMKIAVDVIGMVATTVTTALGYVALKSLNKQNQLFEREESFTSTAGKEIARDIPKRMVGLFFKK